MTLIVTGSRTSIPVLIRSSWQAIEESHGPGGALTAVRIRLQGPAGGRPSLVLIVAPGETPRIDGLELEMGD